MTDTIIAQCNDDICGEMFFVEEVHFGDECRRRPIISKPPIWAKAVIEYEINLLDENSKAGVYELSIQNRRWWVPSKHNNLKQYIRNKGDEWSRPEININLVTHSADQFKNLQNLWRDKVSDAHYEMIKFKVFWWSELSGFLVFILFIILLLIRSIEKKDLSLSIKIFLSFLLLFIITVVLMEYNRSYSFILILIVPGLMILNLFSITLILKHKYQMKKSTQAKLN